MVTENLKIMTKNWL